MSKAISTVRNKIYGDLQIIRMVSPDIVLCRCLNCGRVAPLPYAKVRKGLINNCGCADINKKRVRKVKLERVNKDDGDGIS